MTQVVEIGKSYLFKLGLKWNNGDAYSGESGFHDAAITGNTRVDLISLSVPPEANEQNPVFRADVLGQGSCEAKFAANVAYYEGTQYKIAYKEYLMAIQMVPLGSNSGAPEVELTMTVTEITE